MSSSGKKRAKSHTSIAIEMAYQLGATSMQDRAAKCCDRVARANNPASGDVGAGQVIAATILADAIRSLPLWTDGPTTEER